MSQKFTNSCAPISYPCTVGDKYIDPCNCRRYLECEVSQYDFLERNCGSGTAWNHATGFCIGEDKIFIGNGTPVCEKDKPWSRCKSVPNPYSESRLEKFCNPTDQNDAAGGDEGGGDNAAAIVGGVLGGLLVIVLVAGLVFWWKKRQNQKSENSHLAFRPCLHNQNKEMQEEEVYDVIDEKSVVPVISNYVSSGTEAEYDNTAFESESKTGNGFSNPQQQTQHQEPTTSFKQPMGYLTPEDSTPETRNKSQHLSDSYREDLSRSISVGGKDILVEDTHGYQVGYPSGTVPRQPSPIPPDDFNYNLGTAPLPKEGMELEKPDL